ncbi:Vomp family autotransporter [Bartonella sp. A05]|uniref:Vomp family autotransporter n=1 Tax=Bartonella sp. A05 TaxID=2967261 RepID=UPI0022A986AE|nr:Vomp family autotransporter [Bartonella sp. A05]MCZ2204444.1 Vomp family autotransporter [Bartonella sp. A05]
MKKIKKGNDLNCRHSSYYLPMVKAVSLGATMAVLLSSVSSVSAESLAIAGANIMSNANSVAYPQGSYGSIVFSGVDGNCGADVITDRGSPNLAHAGDKMTVREQYKRFIENKGFGLNEGKHPYGFSDKKIDAVSDGFSMGIETGGVPDAPPSAYGVFSFATGCGSYAGGNYSTAFGANATTKGGGAQAFGVSALATGQASTAMGVGAEARDNSAVAIGGLAQALAVHTVALGAESKANSLNSIAIGYKAESGSDNGVAIGKGAQGAVNDGVALGSESVANIRAGIKGYDPDTYYNLSLDDSNKHIWTSTRGAVSVGDVAKKITRQIVGVAAGKNDTDAVNVAQLKSLKGVVDLGWTVSVNTLSQANITPESQANITPGRTVNFITRDVNALDTAGNIKLTLMQQNSNNNVDLKLELNDHIIVTSVKTGNSTLNDKGLVISRGPRVTSVGIDAGNQKITSIADGTIAANSKDSINGGQLHTIFTKLATIFDGNTEFSDDNFTGPNYNLSNIAADGTEGTDIVHNNVGDALTGLNANIRNVNTYAKYVFDESRQKIQDLSEKALLWDDTSGAFSAMHGPGNNKTMSKITSLAAGNIANGSTDAINGGQINKIAEDVAAAFGGGSAFVNGVFTAPTYHMPYISADGTIIGTDGKIQFDAFQDVRTVFNRIDTNIRNVNEYAKYIARDVKGDFVRLEQDALLWNDTEKAFVATHKNPGEATTENRKITSLANGNIAIASTDAITGSQLYILGTSIATSLGGGAGYNNGAWTNPTFMIAQFNADGIVDQKKSYSNIAEAFEGVNISMTTINQRIDMVKDHVNTNALNWNSRQNAYDATHGDEASKIINVANGTVAKNSNEVVNGGQLWQTNQNIKKVESKVDNMGNQIKGLEGRVVTIENTIQDFNNASEGFVSYDQDAYGRKTNKITLKGGDASQPVVIDKVADGSIQTGSKEAVNGGQLHDYTKNQMGIVLNQAKEYTDEKLKNIFAIPIDDAVTKAKNYTDMKFSALSYQIEDTRKEAKQAAAIGLAVSNLRYGDVPGKLSVAFGGGLWRGQSAVAFGAGYTSENGNIRSNLSVTSSGGHWGVGAGFSLILN